MMISKRVAHLTAGIVLCCISSAIALADGADTNEGGVYFVMRPDIAGAKIDHMDIVWPIVRDALVQERSSVGFISREPRVNGELHVLISESSGAQQAWEAVSNALSDAPRFQGVLSLELLARVEGKRVIVALSEESSEALSLYLGNTTSVGLASRLNALGLENGRIDVLEDGVIRFLGFDTEPANELMSLFETQGQIALRPVAGRTEDRRFDAGLGNDLLPERNKPDSYFIVERQDVIKNQDFLSFETTFDLNGYPAIGFQLGEEGAQKLAAYIQSNLGGIAAIVLDDEVVATTINQVRIPADEGLIAGRFTQIDANRLVAMLNAGFLPVGLDVVQFREISPPLDLPN